MVVKNFDHLRKREITPTKRQEKLYRGWRKYLRDSRLTTEEQHIRAAAFASRNEKVPTND